MSCVDNMVKTFCSHSSVQPQMPSQKLTPLRDDILAVVRFWHSMHADKKYLTASIVSVGGGCIVNLYFDDVSS